MGRMLEAAKQRLNSLGWEMEVDKAAGTFSLTKPTVQLTATAEVTGGFYPGAHLEDEIVGAMEKAIQQRAKDFNVFENVARQLSGKVFAKEDLAWTLFESEEIKDSLQHLSEHFKTHEIRIDAMKDHKPVLSGAVAQISGR